MGTGDFGLTVLGSANAIPQPDRASAGYLLQLDAPVLLDFGTGTLRNLIQTDVAPDRVGAILLSHHHVDHYADLLMYLHFQLRLKEGRAPLTVYGPPGTRSTVEHLRASSP